jgi:hypothetical protein
MITNKQTREFKARTGMGQRPPIPEWAYSYLNESAEKIKDDIEHSIRWEYGNGAHAQKLIQMGLLDKDYNLTELGKEYKIIPFSNSQ